MSYWIGLSEEKQKEYSEEFKNPALDKEMFNPFKIEKCHYHGCDQFVAMKLINDPLSNSSYWVYAGKCVNGHWSQNIPSTPVDVKHPPKCVVCSSYMQWKMSRDYNGWQCLNHCGELQS